MRRESAYRAGLVLLAGFGLCATVNAGVVTGPPLTTFTTADNSKDISLTTVSPTFAADLSSYSSFVGNAYALVGYGSGAVGTADILHQSGATDDTFGEVPSPYFMVGRNANGEIGTVVYKFVLPSGQVTGPGASINANVYFRGEPDTMGANEYLGVNGTADISSNNVEITNIGDFSKETMQTVFSNNNNYASYFQNNVTLSIPQGLNQFFVVAADDGSSGRFAISSLSVNGDVTAVPEPASLAVLLAGLGVISTRKRIRV